MSLTPLFADGFEQYCSAATANATGPTAANSFWSGGLHLVGTNYGRFGSIGTDGSTGASYCPGLASVSIAGVGFGLFTGNGTSAIVVLRDAAGNIQGTVVRNADGSITVFRGNGATALVSSAAAALPANTYVHLEGQCKVDPSAGTWDIWVNGTCVISSSGLNTRGSAVVGSGVAQVGFAAASVYNYDDFHVYDATSRTGASGAGTPASSTFEHYGDKRIQTLFPSGAGTGDVNPSNWTQTGGTGGSPYTAVNERPEDGNTSYLADANAGDIKSFALDDLAPATTGVSAVFPTACFEKDDATARSCAIGIRTSSTNAFGATITSPSAYAYSQVARTTDGAGSALTASGVNGSEILFKVVS